MRRILALLTIWLLALAGRAHAFTGELDLVLERALFHDAQTAAGERANLVLYLQADDGAFEDVWGKALDFSIGEHRGYVADSAIQAEAMTLDVRMALEGDWWVKGRWGAAFKLDLERQPGGVVTGRYTGVFRGQTIEGKVVGRELPRRGGAAGGNLPGPDERPRLLFRAADIPALREKLATPFGQTYRKLAEASGDPINLGVLYRLTGEEKYAKQAEKSIAERYGDKSIPIFGFGSGGFGHEIFAVAMAYDLSADTWDEKLRGHIRAQLAEFTERHQHILMTSHANYHPCSNYYGPGRGVPGVTAMVLWGDGAEEPKKPRNPVARAWPIEPKEGLKPAEKAPICDFKPGEMPREWLWSGALPFEVSRDVLAKLGGYPAAELTVGSRATYLVRKGDWFDKSTLTIRQLDPKWVDDEGINLARAERPDGKGVVAVFYTVLRVAEPVLVSLPTEPDKTLRVLVSGEELESDRFYAIKAGLHPMLVELRTEAVPRRLKPVLAPVDGGDDARVLLYEVDLALWQRDMARWKATGIGPDRRRWVERGWWQNWQHYRWGVGDGGFLAETGGYARIATWYPSHFASFYASFTGRPVSAYNDIRAVMPRQMTQAIYSDSGDPINILKLNSALSLERDWMAVHFPILDPALQPAALWVWNRMVDVGSSDQVDRVLAGAGDGSHRSAREPVRGVTLAQTFINYPLDMKPVHPRAAMPRHWAAKTFGFHVFRSGYEGGNDFVAQVFAKASPIVGWNHPNAAGFQIQGLGHAWTSAPEDRNGVREQYSVVRLPEDRIGQGANGRVIHHAAESNGSGSLTIDMADVYARPTPRAFDGMLLRKREPEPSGITGLRAFAFDWSGKAGAPGLIAIVDRIDGGGPRVWTWQNPGAKVSTHAGGFTLSYPQVSMHATFVDSGKLTIHAGNEDIKVGTAREGFHGRLNRIKATGLEDYFVVLTFQKGDPPAVRVEGTGLDAVVTVGERRVRFDGKKIIIDTHTP